jgi:hypothetical protein
MKYIITESQYKLLFEEDSKEAGICVLPGTDFFDKPMFIEFFFKKDRSERCKNIEVDGDVYLGRALIESLGKIYSVSGYLNLEASLIENLGNLQYVGGNLDLFKTQIESLGNLKEVGGSLDLRGIRIESLGNLQSVGGNLYLENTPLSKKYSEEQIREMVDVGANIYLQ